MSRNKVDDVRASFCWRLKAKKFVTDKSGSKMLEIIGQSFLADEEVIFGEVNHDYVERELAWYKSMSLYVKDIPGKVPEIWKAVADKNGIINSNYGWCVWSQSNFSQYKKCLSELIANKDTRRAVMIYTRPTMHSDAFRDGRSDFMCTNAVQYFIRDGRMDALVQMRSNDVWAGYRNDRAWQEHVLQKLVSDYNAMTESKIDAGDIHWSVGSLHCYERNFWMVDCYDKTGAHMKKADYLAAFPDSEFAR